MADWLTELVEDERYELVRELHEALDNHGKDSPEYQEKLMEVRIAEGHALHPRFHGCRRMASYLIEPHKLRLDYNPVLEEAINYACENRLTLELWPVGQIIPTTCRRIRRKLEITVFGDTPPGNFVVLDELEIGS